MSIIQLVQKPGAGPKKMSQKIGDESRKYPIYFFISLQISCVTCHTCLNTMMSAAPAKASTQWFDSLKRVVIQ